MLSDCDLSCVMGWIKDTIIICGAIIMGILASLQAALTALLICSVFNFYMGWKADVKAFGGRFDIQKAMGSIDMLIFWAVSTVVIYLTISIFGHEEIALGFVKYLTWIVCYWYLVNVLRNAKLVYPSNHAVSFLYDLATVEVLNILKGRFLGNISNHKGQDLEK